MSRIDASFFSGQEVNDAFRMHLANKCNVPLSALSPRLIEAAKERLVFVDPKHAGAQGDPQGGALPQADLGGEFDDRALELPDGSVIEAIRTTPAPPE